MFTRCKNDGNTGTVKRGGGEERREKGGCTPPSPFVPWQHEAKKKTKQATGPDMARCRIDIL